MRKPSSTLKRCSALGNGFHIPSVALVMALILGVAAADPITYAHEACEFQEVIVERFANIYIAGVLQKDMIDVFAGCPCNPYSFGQIVWLDPCNVRLHIVPQFLVLCAMLEYMAVSVPCSIG